jgi:arylsulfatase A-like enzyme
MLTGTDVITNQAVSLAPTNPLDTSIRLLPEILGESGYSSACVGFDGSFFRGFDEYRTYEQWPSWRDAPGHKAEDLNREAIPVLEELAGEPFFLFLRHMDPHTPYLPPPPFRDLFYGKDPCVSPHDSMAPVFSSESFGDFFRSWMPPGIRDIDWVVAQYDSSLAYMDLCIRRLITRLEELGLLENTLVVITSDHGETLTEHGIYFDHHGLYEPTIRIPLILHFPGTIPRGVRCGGMVLQQDLVPTILDIMALGNTDWRSSMDGQSLVPLLEGGDTGSHQEFFLSECTWMRKQGWRTSRYKLIQALEPDLYGLPTWELYDLDEDPGELDNIADDRPDLVDSLRKDMDGWKARRMAESGNPDPLAHSRPSFRASGYRMRSL